MEPPAKQIPPLLDQGSSGNSGGAGRAATGVLTLLALTAALAFARLTEHFNLPIFHCTFKTLTGLPCPFCGGTRSFRALAHLDLPSAIFFNPLAVIATFTLAAAALLHLTLPRNTTDCLVQSLKRYPWPKILIPLALLNWIYLVLFLPR